MTYYERESLLQHQQPYSQRSIFNKSNNRTYPSRLLPSQSLRIQCKSEERHFIDNTSSYAINSSLKPIRFTMNDQLKPIKFRSEIIVHNNPETDLHIKRLQVAFHYHDASPTNAMLNHHSSSSHSQSLHTSKPLRQQQQTDNNSRKNHRSTTLSQPQVLLHQWIDDICANEQLMANDDIVFFIKNGEFFARI